MNEVHARVEPRHFRYLEIQSGEFPRSAERLSVRHNFGNHSPFVSRTCCQRLWIQQERLRSPRTRAIAPRGKDAVAGNNASSEVWQIVDARPFTRHDHIRKQRICTGTPIGSFSSLIHWHAERDRVCVAQDLLAQRTAKSGTRDPLPPLEAGKSQVSFRHGGALRNSKVFGISLEVASDRNLPIASVNAQCRADS